LILTGARLREVLNAKWTEVDLERGVLRLADSKTGRKTIYLSDAAIAIVKGLTRIEDNPYLIVGDKEGSNRSDIKRPWEAIRKAADLNELRLHDLRHSFASFGAGASLGLPIIGKLLGHSQASTTQRYAHLDADPLHRAANVIGGSITEVMSRKT
jgi:integrase